jgi:hypothetical protein
VVIKISVCEALSKNFPFQTIRFANVWIYNLQEWVGSDLRFDLSEARVMTTKTAPNKISPPARRALKKHLLFE